MYFSKLLVALQLRPRGPCGKPHYSCNHEDHVVSRATAAAWSRDSVFQSSASRADIRRSCVGRFILASARPFRVAAVVGGAVVACTAGGVGTVTRFGSSKQQTLEFCTVLGNPPIVYGLASDEDVLFGCTLVAGRARLAVPTVSKFKRSQFFEQGGSDITRSELKDFTLRVSSDKRGIPLFRVEVPFQVNVIYYAVCLLGRAIRGCVATADTLAS